MLINILKFFKLFIYLLLKEEKKMNVLNITMEQTQGEQTLETIGM